jgi:tetratricopeptide (TPR) repeat protein
VIKAFGTENNIDRREISEMALRLSPSCAEAYIVRADVESEPVRKIEMLEKATQIAFDQLDSSRFQRPDGYFWQMMITRPYMRCITALALALWETGDKSSAIDHFKALLKLNPADNQGLRFRLLNWMLAFDASNAEVDKYLTEYEREQSAFGTYARALWQFIRHGDGKPSQIALRKAIESNKFVPALLCGTVKSPSLKITRVVRGTPEEAIAYQRTASGAWQTADGALDWLARNCSALLHSKSISRKIAAAKEFRSSGAWVAPAPAELRQ